MQAVGEAAQTFNEFIDKMEALNRQIAALQQERG